MPNKLIAIYFGPTANLLMIDFKFLQPFVFGRTWECKQQSFLPDELAFLKKKKGFKSKVFTVMFCWQTADTQWAKLRQNGKSSSEIS